MNWGQCREPGCTVDADCDGWCDDHSSQFQRFGTHQAVGPHGPPDQGVRGATGADSPSHAAWQAWQRARPLFDALYVDRTWPTLHRTWPAAFVAWLRGRP